MFIWWVIAGWILDFQYCKWVLNFLQYFFNVKWSILFCFIKKHFPDYHSVHWGINSPLKNTTPLILAKLTRFKSANCSSPLSKQSPLYIGFSWTFPKGGIFQWTPKISKFFILNTILSFKSNQIPSSKVLVWILSYDRENHFYS